MSYVTGAGSPQPAPQPIPAEIRAEVERTTWLDLACIVLVLVGALNVIDGLAAIRGSGYIADHLLFANLDAWGWLVLIWGVVQILAGLAVYRGAPWGAFVALGTAFGNAIIQLGWVDTDPFWSLTIIGLDVLVIYGLVARVGLGQRAR
jgi:hypothetical protein